MAAPQSALDWEGQTLLDRAGDKVGTIEEIFLVEETGRPEWALVKLGRLRSHTTLVPLTSAQAVDDGIKVGYEKDVVSDAPQIEADKEPSEQEVDAVYRHYGIALGGAPASETANGSSNGSHGDLRDEPIGEVVKQVSEETKTLVGKEVKLAKTEMVEKAKEVGIGAGLFGGAGYLLNLVAIGLMLTAIFALATAMDAWLAALVVTVVLLALAGVLALTGKKRIQNAGPPVPEQAIDSVKQTIETVKEEARWGLNQTR
ncbi:MAG: hypothetical protein QOD69_1844 [Solirubrobacteraceae bacterium]|nr:hypothetical protein [Solirubrobacteraceae bacterium]